jgi:glycerophosphoryl diester phosphodiesterase
MNLKCVCVTITGVLALIPSIFLFIFLFAFQGAKPDTPCAGQWGPVTYYQRGNLTSSQENTFDAVVTGTVLNGKNPGIDVSVLKDGGVVLFHDKSMARMTGIDKDIKDVTTEEALSTPILQVIDGYQYSSTNSIPEIEPVIHAICNADETIGINFDTKAEGAVDAGVSALKTSNCTDTSDNTIWASPYPGVVKLLKKRLKDAGLDNRIAMYMPSGEYSFLGLKFFLKTRLLQAAFAPGSSIIELHKTVHDAEPELIQSWVDDGWCIGIWGITPDEMSAYTADVYILDEAPVFPNFVESGLGKDGEPKKNCL